MRFCRPMSWVLTLSLITGCIATEQAPVSPLEAAAGSIVITNSIGMKLKLIPPGTFKMGSPKTESDRNGMEKPVREITISKPFYIGVYEVTQQEWAAIMGNNPSGSVGKKKPVELVAWNDAQDFLAKLSAKEGVEYRLPTEAEWEYAARAGTDTEYYWGELWDDDYGWSYANSDHTTHDVGLKKPNAWGLYDVSGNVWEWCQDWYDKYPKTPKATDPQGPSGDRNRVCRGGSWNRVPDRSRSAFRECDTPVYQDNTNGLRVVRTLNVITNSIGMKFKLIQPGTFNMGYAGDEKRETTISKPFYIGVYEVTQLEWAAVMGNNPSGSVGKKKPVDLVSWNDAQEFLAKLSKKEGVEYRLPTGAEWEYAARAGTDTPYYWGESWDDAYGWCSGNSDQTSHDVGMKKPNAWGLYDTSGNVWEWCQDWFEDSRPNFAAWPRLNRVVRGGSWNRGPGSSVSASNDGDTPGYRFNTCGLRVVRTP